MNKPELRINVVIVGASTVGKTSLANQLVNNCFNEHYETTHGMDIFSYKMELDNCVVSLTLRDTCGQEQYRSLAAQYYRETHGALVVYDISNRDSFEYLQDWVNDVSNYCPQGVKIVVVGNKVDLADEDLRVVSTEEGQKFSNEGNFDFFETSAKRNIKVEAAFRDLVTKIVQSENLPKQSQFEVSTSKVSISTESSKENKKCC
ncbi:Rab family GTPase [Entamoeba histolytica HM-1:IMSS-B]|uniref:Rab family GTPase n=7 Tax=Entamoeba TaxID=5758 RepID=A0A8U0WPR3_ENTH1|eukprot:XP_008860642.1 Rab family GTPase [Entamoeba nuttalli P19]